MLLVFERFYYHLYIYLCIVYSLLSMIYCPRISSHILHSRYYTWDYSFVTIILSSVHLFLLWYNTWLFITVKLLIQTAPLIIGRLKQQTQSFQSIYYIVLVSTIIHIHSSASKRTFWAIINTWKKRKSPYHRKLYSFNNWQMVSVI